MVVTQRRRVQFDLTVNTAKPRFVDGEELPEWQDGPDMVEYIRQLVEEGWTVTEDSSYVVIFERPLPQEAS